MVKDANFKVNTRKSFIRVKEDINRLKNLLNEQNNHLLDLKLLINTKSAIIDELNTKIDLLTKSSTGNKGVGKRLEIFQPPTNHPPTTPPLTPKISNFTDDNIKNLQKEVIRMVKSMTSKQFGIFMTVIALESSLKNGVSYDDLASNLSVSRRTINWHINNMILKGVPIKKIEGLNEKTLIFVKKEFKDLNVNQDLAKLKYYIDSRGLDPDDLDNF